MLKLIHDTNAAFDEHHGYKYRYYPRELCIPAAHGQEHIVKFLFNECADSEACSDMFDVALKAASANGYGQVVRFFLDRNASVYVKFGCFYEATSAAARGRHNQILELLLNTDDNPLETFLSVCAA
jgi:hypothetical protein